MRGGGLRGGIERWARPLIGWVSTVQGAGTAGIGQRGKHVASAEEAGLAVARETLCPTRLNFRKTAGPMMRAIT